MCSSDLGRPLALAQEPGTGEQVRECINQFAGLSDVVLIETRVDEIGRQLQRGRAFDYIAAAAAIQLHH